MFRHGHIESMMGWRNPQTTRCSSLITPVEFPTPRQESHYCIYFNNLLTLRRMSLRRGQASLARHGAVVGGQPTLIMTKQSSNSSDMCYCRCGCVRLMVCGASCCTCLLPSKILINPEAGIDRSCLAMKTTVKQLELACRRMLQLGVPVET